MAQKKKQMQIVVPPEIYEELYTLKGYQRSFADVIRGLLDTVYPRELDDPYQTTLKRCPACGEDSLAIDQDGEYFCKNRSCEYEPEEGEL
jgi:hypothetical protein